jgi:hypothetical protein
MNSNVTYVGVKSDERIKITQEENQTAAWLQQALRHWY